MLYEIRQKAIAAKLIAIAAMLVLSLGVIFIGAGQAYATHAEPEIYKMEVTVDAPVVGEAPANTFTVVLSKKDGTTLPNNEHGTNLRWSGVSQGSVNEFEADKTYKAICEITYYDWHGSLSECPGVADTAEGYVNGKPSTSKPSVYHDYQSMHLVGVTYSWTLHEVTFNSNGGSGEMAAQTVYEDEGTKLSKNTFAFDGQKFTGWNTKADGSGKAYTDEESVNLKESTTLYAQWVPATYKVTVTADPTEGGTASADKQEAAKGDTVTLSVSPKDEYEFVEWVPVTEGVTIKDGKFTMPASDVEVKATFKEKPQPKPQPITVTHTVTFDANGGTGAMDPLTGEEGTEVALTANKFARDGYAFKGWNTEADGSGTAYADKATVKLDDDIALYAQWEALPAPIVTHTVTFDANGGTGAMDPLTGEEGTEVALTANKFARDGYTFKGWNTKADGSGTAYADKATVKLDNDITLYAQWEKKAASSSSTKATSSTKTSSSNTLAKTGDFTPFVIGGIALVAMLAAGVLALARRRAR